MGGYEQCVQIDVVVVGEYGCVELWGFVVQFYDLCMFDSNVMLL